MTRLLALLLVCGAGCADGRSALSVIVDSDEPIALVQRLVVQVTDLGNARPRLALPVIVPLAGAPVTLPPPQHFSLVFDASVRGPVSLQVTALDPSDTALAVVTRTVTIAPSQTQHLTINLVSLAERPDLGELPDLTDNDASD